MKIAVIAGAGMGGTEKAAYMFAVELKRRGHQVDVLMDSNVHWVSILTQAGVHTLNVPYTQEGLSEYIRKASPAVIHNHTSGYADMRFIYATMDEYGDSRPKLIETNVFGRLRDRNDNGRVDFRMFVSMASGCQAFLRPRFYRGEPSSEKHGVLYNPLPPEIFDTTPETQLVSRQALGIAANAIVLVRVGLPGNKWAKWECEAFKIASRSILNLHLILMEPTDDVKASVRDNAYGPAITILKATSDPRFIQSLYQMSDIMLHASKYGESYGYTLAEGMRERLPIITRTTPWGDNAQVELVRHCETGFVCCGILGMAKAVVQLAKSSAMRNEMAAAAGMHVTTVSDLTSETDLLEEVLQYVTGNPAGPLMLRRFEGWMNYRNNAFAKAEWNVFERTTKNLSNFLIGRLHGFYKMGRSVISSVYWNLRYKLML